MCTFEGIPSPSLKWLHNGVLVSNSNDSITITNTSSLSDITSVLQWMNVPMEAEGIFVCVVTNYLGSRRKLINVRIHGKYIYVVSRFGCNHRFFVWGGGGRRICLRA